MLTMKAKPPNNIYPLPHKTAKTDSCALCELSERRTKYFDNWHNIIISLSSERPLYQCMPDVFEVLLLSNWNLLKKKKELNNTTPHP